LASLSAAADASHGRLKREFFNAIYVKRSLRIATVHVAVGGSSHSASLGVSTLMDDGRKELPFFESLPDRVFLATNGVFRYVRSVAANF
jgi:hypothetical protein